MDLHIVKYPHPALRTKAEAVKTIDKDLNLLAGQMLELMYDNEGVGLAAPQVAQGVRMLVMNFAGDAEKKDQECVAINPTVVDQKGSVEDREGCLSFPGLFQKVRRAKTVTVRAYNLKGEQFEMTASGLAARIWLHEIDHLNGVLFIDKMGMFGRMNSKQALKELQAEFEKALKRGDYPADTAPKL